VTTATLVTEVADETAQGRYMAVCAHAHLTADRALIQYLYDVDAPSQVRWDRGINARGDMILCTRRPRPAALDQRTTSDYAPGGGTSAPAREDNDDT